MRWRKPKIGELRTVRRFLHDRPIADIRRPFVNVAFPKVKNERRHDVGHL